MNEFSGNPQQYTNAPHPTWEELFENDLYEGRVEAIKEQLDGILNAGSSYLMCITLCRLAMFSHDAFQNLAQSAPTNFNGNLEKVVEEFKGQLKSAFKNMRGEGV